MITSRLYSRKSGQTLKNLSFYFSSHNHQEELEKIVSDPLFAKIVDYLYENKEQEIILRRIKAEIPTQKNIELYLDKLIKYNIIKRENRRYSLKLPIYSINQQSSLSNIEELLPRWKEIADGSAEINKYFLIGEWLWSFLFKKEEDYFFGVQNAPIFFDRREQGNEQLQFVSIFQENIVPFDLANYFTLLSNRQKLPDQFLPLLQTIGDVDIDYFIPQVQKVIRAANRQKIKEAKRNIFQESLLLTHDIKRNEEGNLTLNVAIVACDEQNLATIQGLESIKKMLVSMWQEIEDSNQRMLLKKQLYHQLFRYSWSEEESINYFKE